MARSACSTSRCPNALDECTATYFADYSNYNSNLVGLVVGAEDLGLNNANAKLAYQVTACTGTFTGDVPGQFCDTAGDVDPSTGIYTAQLNATDPALDIDPLVCRGFWDGGACNGRRPDRGLDRVRGAGRRPRHPGPVPEQRTVAQPDGGDHEHRAVKATGPVLRAPRSATREPVAGSAPSFLADAENRAQPIVARAAPSS